MAGGGFVPIRRPLPDYEGGVTAFVILACMVAAMGGLLFGYDLGISGGVTSMDDFLKKFFPSVYQKTQERGAAHNSYCVYDNHLLTLFTSSLYFAALVASLFASKVTRSLGRRVSVFVGGLAFLFGAIINGFATNVELLIIGRLLLGVGVGFSNQAVPVYLCEMAPAKIRGALSIGILQMAIAVGLLLATFVNYQTAAIEGGWGWRVSLTLAAIPAVLMTIGSLFLPDTPSSTIERGHQEEARRILQKIRGTENVDQEFWDLVAASEAAKKVDNSWKNIFLPRYRPQLVICFLIPLFQQLTGINVIMFYSPVIFMTLGFGDKAALMSATITGFINVLATLVSVFSVDKFGRRALFLQAGVQIVICQVAVGAMIGLRFGVTGKGFFVKNEADLLLFLICAYVAAFSWSWGPLAWLIPGEICPLEVRSAGQAVNVFGNNLITFIIAQAFLSMLCRMKFGIFFFFAGLVVLMTIFVFLFVPETKNVPIEEMGSVFKAHWFWGKYIPDEALPGDADKNSYNA